MEMSIYFFLPLVSFFIEIFLGIYILYKDSKATLNRLYSLVIFSIAVWCLGYPLGVLYLPEASFVWKQLEGLGSSLTPAFLLHFYFVFTKRPFISRKLNLILVYLPAIFFTLVSLARNFVHGLLETSLDIILNLPLSVYAIGYYIACLLFCYIFYSKTTSKKEKNQAMLLLVATSISLVMAIIEYYLLSPFGLNVVALALTLEIVITSAIIVYAITKHQLMTPLSFSIQKRLVVGFLGFALLVGAVNLALMGLINETAGNVTNLSLNSLGISIILGLVAAFYLSSSISKPIKKLTQIIEDISTGELNVEIDPKLKQSKDEIGALARAFDRTIVSLKLAMKQSGIKYSSEIKGISEGDLMKEGLLKKSD